MCVWFLVRVSYVKGIGTHTRIHAHAREGMKRYMQRYECDDELDVCKEWNMLLDINHMQECECVIDVLPIQCYIIT